MYVSSSNVASKQKRSKVHHNSGEHGFYVADSLKIKMGYCVYRYAPCCLGSLVFWVSICSSILGTVPLTD